jgi:hypothetical protein
MRFVILWTTIMSAMRGAGRGGTWRALGTALALGALLLGLPGCKNSTTPDGDQKARIVIRNNIGIAVDIYVDGVFQFYLEQREYYFVENVSLKAYSLEARKKGTEIILQTAKMEITENRDYYWTINSSAVVTITNHYGETLSIYADGTYQTDVDNQSSASIESAPYGDHLFEAKRPNQSEVLASTRIEILSDKVYTWTITP